MVEVVSSLELRSLLSGYVTQIESGACTDWSWRSVEEVLLFLITSDPPLAFHLSTRVCVIRMARAGTRCSSLCENSAGSSFNTRFDAAESDATRRSVDSAFVPRALGAGDSTGP